MWNSAYDIIKKKKHKKAINKIVNDRGYNECINQIIKSIYINIKYIKETLVSIICDNIMCSILLLIL